MEGAKMDSGKLNDWLQVVGLLGLLGGLIFVGLQLQQDRAIAVVSGTEDAVASRLYWAELVADNSPLWTKGLSGDALSAEESTAFSALATALDLQHYVSWRRASALGTEDQAKRFVREAAYDLQASPGLIAWWQSHQERMGHIGMSGTRGEDWITAVNEQLMKFQAASGN
jgi:hypothetical protein